MRKDEEAARQKKEDAAKENQAKITEKNNDMYGKPPIKGDEKLEKKKTEI